MSILIIAPHPDDESIGCGGTICLHSDRGERTVAVFLTSGELGLEHLPREEAWRVREGEAEAAAEILEHRAELRIVRVIDGREEVVLELILEPAAQPATCFDSPIRDCLSSIRTLSPASQTQGLPTSAFPCCARLTLSRSSRQDWKAA